MGKTFVYSIDSKIGDYSHFERIMVQNGAKPLNKQNEACQPGESTSIFSFKGSPVTYHKGYRTKKELAISVPGYHSDKVREILASDGNTPLYTIEDIAITHSLMVKALKPN